MNISRYKHFTTSIAGGLFVVALLIMPIVGTATADELDVVQSFYDYLSHPTSEQHADAMKSATSAEWESIGDYSGQNKTIDSFLAQIGGFGKLIPDLD